jgi:hypothetical protein
VLQKDKVAGSYINRPMLNLNRPELDLDHRIYLQWSPLQRKNFLTTFKLLKNDNEKRWNVYYKTNRFNDIMKSKINDKDSIEYFQRGMFI